jgi:hypothetical protein
VSHQQDFNSFSLQYNSAERKLPLFQVSSKHRINYALCKQFYSLIEGGAFVGRTLTSKDVCRELNIPFYKLQYLFDTGKISDVQRTSSGKRIYDKEDIKVIREALFEVMAKD